MKTRPRGASLRQLVLVVAYGILGALLIWSDLLWRWENVFYDAQLKLWTRPAANDIVIVAIDETSLSTLGRWPWSRRLHARLVEILSAEGAKVIGLDILFPEPSANDPQADQKLTDAVAAHGRVVLPITTSQLGQNTPFFELLPIPALASVSHLGHVNVELDADGIARRVYLKEGLGTAFWPSFSLVMMSGGPMGEIDRLPGTRNRLFSDEQHRRWTRDHEVLLPFAGPAGRFTRVSYSDVLAGDYPRGMFDDAIVFVGVTAPGLGDILPTLRRIAAAAV